MTATSWSVELLPVFLQPGGGIRWLSLAAGEAWRVPAAAARSPHDTVIGALRVFGIGPFVAHSTSWRFDYELVLTYLVLLPTLHAEPPTGFEVHVVGRESLARGELAAPPPRIGVEQVLEHALRHLAWLAGDDPAIRQLLARSWLEALAVYQPEPFRSVQETFSA